MEYLITENELNHYKECEELACKYQLKENDIVNKLIKEDKIRSDKHASKMNVYLMEIIGCIDNSNVTESDLIRMGVHFTIKDAFSQSTNFFSVVREKVRAEIDRELEEYKKSQKTKWFSWFRK